MNIASQKQEIISILSILNNSKGKTIPGSIKRLKQELCEESYRVLVFGDKKVSDQCTLIESINCWSIKSILDYWKNVRKELSEEDYQKNLIAL